MKYNKSSIKKIEKECTLCRDSFVVWLTTLNFDRDKEENIKKSIYNHCPSCRVLEKSKKNN
jgi:hypothetical protein